jgi:hypothetical protein
MPTIIQRIIQLGPERNAQAEMMFRVNDLLLVDASIQGVQFLKGGIAFTDTFFNGLSVGSWKDNTRIDDLALVFRGRGRFVVRLGLHRVAEKAEWLSETTLYLEDETDASIPIMEWNSLVTGMLFFSIEALEKGILSDAFYQTDTAPVRTVKLGAVIPHYDKKHYVLPTIRKMRDELLSDEAYRGKIELVIIDNSQNITAQEAEGAILISNSNICGCSGGFMRGLLYLKDEGSFTHCLFLDDDGAFEIESVRRTYALLQYATTDRMAISGTFFLESNPSQIFEKGAICDFPWRGLKRGLDSLCVGDLLEAETVGEAPTYGAFWFFAFCLKDVKSHLFPFYIRGEDVLFGTLNRFKVVTMNGIACWGPDFIPKESALSRYFDARSRLMLALSGVIRLPGNVVARRFKRTFFEYLYSMNYGSARALTKAMTDVMMGPDFWVRNMDISAVRAEIASFSKQETKVQTIMEEFEQVSLNQDELPEGPLRRLWRKRTLQGFLLPFFLLKDRNKLLCVTNLQIDIKKTFRFRRVLYTFPPGNSGYIVTHQKVRFFVEFLRFYRAYYRLILQYKNLQRAYEEALPRLTNEAFWRGVYREESDYRAAKVNGR